MERRPTRLAGPVATRRGRHLMHPRNRFGGGYDVSRLIEAHPPLRTFVVQSPRGEATIEFADPAAVLALNQALLADTYGLQWSVPTGALCPPIPGRSDYLHHLADLLAGETTRRFRGDRP